MQVPYYTQYMVMLDIVGDYEPMFKDSVYKVIKIEIPKNNSDSYTASKKLVNPWEVALHQQ